MTNVKMPEPVVWRSKYKSEPGMIGNYPWSYVEYSLRQTALKSYDIESLITTTQAQAYADERVKEALNRVLDALVDCHIDNSQLEEISGKVGALFPKQPTQETEK